MEQYEKNPVRIIKDFMNYSHGKMNYFIIIVFHGCFFYM